MNINIQSRPFTLTAALEAYIHRRITGAFTRGPAPSDGVSVILSDINGPRGGRDKQCKLQFSVPGLGLVVIRDTQEDLYHAIDSAVHRARHAIARGLARRRALNKRRPKLNHAQSVEPQEAWTATPASAA